MYVSADYFDTVGVTMARGAGFDDAVDNDAAAQPVVVVAYEFWQNRLGSDPDILGKTLVLNRVAHVVAGIAQESFIGHLQEEGTALLWVPLRQHPRLRAEESVRFDRNVDWLRIHGRLDRGMSIEQANAAVSGVMSGLAERYPSSNRFKAASVEPYHAQGAASRAEFLLLQAMFLGMAGTILLVVCLNISGMMLVRGAMRERELSIRQAIGAGRGQLIRYLLCEAIVLAVLAGALAFLVIFGGVQVVFTSFLGSVPPALQLDARMLLMCLGLCLVTSLLFGLIRSRGIRVSRQDDTTPVSLRHAVVDEGYVRTMGIRLVRGRSFTADDRAGAELVAMIAEPVAVRLFPNADPVGQRIVITFENETKVVTLVGVIADLVGSQMSNPRGQILLPLAQHPASNVFLIARSADSSRSASLAPAFRAALRDINPDFAGSFASRHPGYSSGLVRGETLVENSMNDMLTQSSHAAAFGGVALTLAALGVYGVVGFMLAMRTREMAVRIALGATPRRVLGRIFLDVVMLVAPGVAVGLLISIFYVRVSYLSWYSLGGVEPLVYAAAAVITVFVALLASLPSARRAASVQPMTAMRSE